MREETVWDIIKESVREGRDYRSIVNRRVLGTTVLTKYNNKTYRGTFSNLKLSIYLTFFYLVDDIDWNQRVSSTFSTPAGDISYNQYYKQRYQIDNLDQDQPLIISKAKARDIRGGSNELFSLIPQLCIMTGINESMRTNFNQMRELSQHTRLSPQDRITRLRTLNGRLQKDTTRKIFTDNRIELGRELVRVKGRRIVQEAIRFGNNQIVQLQQETTDAGEAADWTRSCRNNVMVKAYPLTKWVFICPSSCREDGEKFLTMLTEVSAAMGMVVSQNFRRKYLDDNRIASYLSAIEEFLAKDPYFFVIVVDNMRADCYAAIKKLCYCNQNRPVPSQIIVKRTISSSRNLMSVATKVGIQINCKLGGIPWVIKIPLDGLLLIGFDVTHDTNNKRMSYGAMVANLNPQENGGSFYSQVNRHEDGIQLSNHFGTNIVAAITKYKEVWKQLPEKIIIYRDGVGDGQIEYVYNNEVKDIEAKLNHIYRCDPEDEKKKSYNLMFVIINKKINTRFFRDSRNR